MGVAAATKRRGVGVVIVVGGTWRREVRVGESVIDHHPLRWLHYGDIDSTIHHTGHTAGTATAGRWSFPLRG